MLLGFILKQRRLRQRQDEVGFALASAHSHGPEIVETLGVETSVFRRLREIRKPLLRYFEASGAFYMHGGRGPWITLPLVEGEAHSTCFGAVRRKRDSMRGIGLYCLKLFRRELRSTCMLLRVKVGHVPRRQRSVRPTNHQIQPHPNGASDGASTRRQEGQCDSGAPGMTAPDIAALRQLAARVLVNKAGPDADAASVAIAARRRFEELAGVLTPLIGQVGIDALAARALHLAQREYPWLGKTRNPEHVEGRLLDVSLSLEHQAPGLAAEAAAAVLARFTALLVTMVGEPLTVRLMRQAWPDGFSDA